MTQRARPPRLPAAPHPHAHPRRLGPGRPAHPPHHRRADPPPDPQLRPARRPGLRPPRPPGVLQTHPPRHPQLPHRIHPAAKSGAIRPRPLSRNSASATNSLASLCFSPAGIPPLPFGHSRRESASALAVAVASLLIPEGNSVSRFASLLVIPVGNLLLPPLLPLPFACHSRRESAFAVAVAVASLVIPEGNLRLPSLLPLPLCLSFPKGRAVAVASLLSFPKGICVCPRCCRCLFACHSRRESASASCPTGKPTAPKVIQLSAGSTLYLTPIE